MGRPAIAPIYGARPENQYRNVKRQDQKREQDTAPAGPEGQRRTDTAHKAEDRCAEQHGRDKRAKGAGWKIVEECQNRCGDQQQHAGCQPMGQRLCQGQCPQSHRLEIQQVEAAILMVGGEHAF